ncbi:unnamed protein product, partial [marine sediment metagenome]
MFTKIKKRMALTVTVTLLLLISCPALAQQRGPTTAWIPD